MLLSSAQKILPILLKCRLIGEWVRSCLACPLLLTKFPGFSRKKALGEAWASQAGGAKPWKVRRHLRDYIIGLLLYTGGNRPSLVAAGSELGSCSCAPSSPCDPPGRVVPTTPQRKADPTPGGAGQRQSPLGAWEF